MIDKKMGEKQLQIEVSCGNAGNSIDGQLPSASKTSGNDTDSITSGNYDDGGELLCPFFTLSGILGTCFSFWLFSVIIDYFCVTLVAMTQILMRLEPMMILVTNDYSLIWYFWPFLANFWRFWLLKKWLKQA